MRGFLCFAIILRPASGIFPVQGPEVKFPDPGANLFPGNLLYLLLALLLQVTEEALAMADAVDGISKGMDIPVIDLDTIMQNLGATALLGND